MDEVQYVNDPDRGNVLESTFMMLPPHIQLVMLSATIDKPENFACWCENLHKNSKQVYLTNTTHRVVPLTHYSFIMVNQGIFKAIKDKSVHAEINSIINKPFVIQDAKNVFNDEHYFKMTKMLQLFETNNIRVKRSHVLNQVPKYLTEHEMLPALCFVLSRKQLEICANEITTSLLEFDSKVPYIIDHECEQLLRSKLANFEEYLHLPEYVNMVSLLRKGIAIHHSGIIPVLKEIVEILYAKGYIKLLFATETFSIGVNMPTRTVLFTDVNKFDGHNNRILYSHEMSQMSGRAGRRGIDKVGHVIHLNNLFRDVDSVSYKKMMNGKPQTLTSKFKISYNLILNLIDIGEIDYTKYTKKSMIQGDIDNITKQYNNDIVKLEGEIANIQKILDKSKIPIEKVEEYIELKKKRLTSVNKKRKELDRSIQNIVNEYMDIEKDVDTVSRFNLKRRELNNLHDQLTATQSTLETNVKIITDMLEHANMVLKEDNDTGLYGLTLKGRIATHLKEVHCLIFAEMIESSKFRLFEAKELVGILSCFTNISVSEDKRAISCSTEHTNTNVKKTVMELSDMYQKQSNLEAQNRIDTGIDYSIHFDLIDYVIKWCECDSEITCKQLLQQLGEEKEIFLGEFVKAILKINNITAEMEKIAETLGDVEFLSVLKQVPHLTLKYVATNQSLYV